MSSLSDCKNPSLAAAASIIVSNVDLLTLILIRLPVKSLLVFKSVSKQLLSIISDPFFSNKYNHQNSLSIRGLYIQSWYSDVKKLDYIPLDGSSSSPLCGTLSFINHPYGTRIAQSCNGLMCCRSSCDANGYYNLYPTYYICNPSTRKYRPILCESQYHEKGFNKLSSVSLAYDPIKSHHYKVVCIWVARRVRNNDYQIRIYSSETDSWKLSKAVFSRPCLDYFGSGVFWNGSLHWVDTTNKGSFFYFDVDRELIMEMEMPSYDEDPGMEEKLFSECKGHLYVLPTRVFSPTSFQIFEMKADYTGWSARYLVNHRELLLLGYPRFYLYVLLVREEEGEPPNLVFRVRNKVFSYDLQNMSLKEIQELAPCDRQNVAYQYTRTLACV